MSDNWAFWRGQGVSVGLAWVGVRWAVRRSGPYPLRALSMATSLLSAVAHSAGIADRRAVAVHLPPNDPSDLSCFRGLDPLGVWGEGAGAIK